MTPETSLQQAREWVKQGNLEPAKELLLSLRRQFEHEAPAPMMHLDMWRGLLTVAHLQCDLESVHELVGRTLQFARNHFEFDSPQMGALMHQAAQALASVGAGAEAETFYLQAYRRLGHEPLARCRYALELSCFYSFYGHLDHAMRWAKEAAVKSAELDEAMQLTCGRLVAALLDAQNKCLEAQKLRQAGTEEPGPMQGWLLLDQARSQRRLGWAGKAADLYRAALPLLPEGERARIYRELALTLLSRRDLAGAAAALQEGLSLTDATSFAAALLRAEQARLAQFEGRFAEVEPALLEVLSSWEERYQPYHPLCLRLREVLVELCILRRDWATGLQRARQLVVLANQDPTCCAPRVARGLYWMAMVWLYQGDRESAKQALYQAQLLWDSWLDLWDVERAQIGYGSGLVTMDEMEFYKAEDYVRKACDMVEQGFSEQSVALGFFFTGLAEIHKVTGRERQAQEVSQRAQELLRPKR